MSITRLYKTADSTMRDQGAAWYFTANKIARAMAKKYSVSPSIAAAVIAALSPANTWKNNLIAAETVLERRGDNPKSYHVAGWPANKIKAAYIARTGDISALTVKGSGLKIQSFYDNILTPATSQAVTIDRWMLRAAGYEVKSPSLTVYNKVADNIRRLAVDLMPHQVQAIVWIAIRGGHE